MPDMKITVTFTISEYFQKEYTERRGDPATYAAIYNEVIDAVEMRFGGDLGADYMQDGDDE